MGVMPVATRKPRRGANAGAPAHGRTPRLSGAAALDAQLDLALIATFPASDPVAIGRSTALEPPSRPVERGAAGMDRELIELIRTSRQRARDT